MAAAGQRVSPEEYLAFERASEERHEYVDGEIRLMPSATLRHSMIGGNVLVALHTALRPRRAVVLGIDMRIHMPSTGGYTYADGLVVCDEPVLADDARDNLLNPAIIVEVLSNESEAYDRGDKFEHFRSIVSFRDYLLVSQRKVRIEHFHKQPDGTWLLRAHGPGERLILESHACDLAVDEVYLKVFDEPAA